MAVSVCRDFVDPQTFQAVTELIDSFGNKVLIQTPILIGNHAAEVAAMLATMAQNESSFISKLKAAPFNYSDQQIQALQKAPGDCGCK